MILLPIKPILEENNEFFSNSLCQETLLMTISFYQRVGFVEPWICYYAQKNGELVGSAGFKGKPVEGIVEIAYGTFDKYQKQGIGTEICRKMVEVSLKADPLVRIRARTLSQYNFSTKILEKNDFRLLGTVIDPEDGEVWEWEFRGLRNED